MLMKKEYPSVLKNRPFQRLCAALFTSLTATYAIYFASMALVGRRGGLLSKERWISLGFIALGLGLAALPFLSRASGPSLLLLAAVGFAIGLGLALITIPAKTILQERPPAGMRGRVISTQLVLGNAASTLPMPLGGGLADLIGIRKVLLILACVTLGAAAASVHRTRG